VLLSKVLKSLFSGTSRSSGVRFSCVIVLLPVLRSDKPHSNAPDRHSLLIDLRCLARWMGSLAFGRAETKPELPVLTGK
jgi:hypothetical protein